jgi:hypothetical protein
VTRCFCKKIHQVLLTVWPDVFVKNLPNTIDSVTRCFCEEIAQYYWQCDQMFLWKTRPILLTVWPDVFVKNLPNIIDSVTKCFLRKTRPILLSV